MTLADYLAKNYLTADARAEPKTKKKRKRKPDVGISGLVIADDDDSAWPAAPAGKDEDDDEPMNGSPRPLSFPAADHPGQGPPWSSMS